MMVDYLRADKHNGCPCRGCGERHVGCHGKCERYGGWQAVEAERKKERERERNRRGYGISDAAVRKIWKKQRWSYQQTRRRSDGER